MNVSQEQITLLNKGLEEYIKHINDHFDNIFNLLDFNEILKNQEYQQWLNDFSFRKSLFKDDLFEFTPDDYLLKKSFQSLSFEIDPFSKDSKNLHVYFCFFNENVSYIYKKLLSINIKPTDKINKYSTLRSSSYDDDKTKDQITLIQELILKNFDDLLKVINNENKFYQCNSHSSGLIKERLFNKREVFDLNNLEHLLLSNAVFKYKQNIRNFLGS